MKLFLSTSLIFIFRICFIKFIVIIQDSNISLGHLAIAIFGIFEKLITGFKNLVFLIMLIISFFQFREYHDPILSFHFTIVVFLLVMVVSELVFSGDAIVLLTPNKWHYLVIAVGNGEVKIYGNSNLVKVGKCAGKGIKASNMSLFTENWINKDRGFYGIIEELLISNKMKSGFEIKDPWYSIDNTITESSLNSQL
jgi:hypothetical protein